MVRSQKAGPSLSVMAAFIAATAETHGLTLGATCSCAVPVYVQELAHQGDPCTGTATHDATTCI
jgi:hypothetical protein